MSTNVHCWKVLCNYKWYIPCYFVDAESEDDAIKKAIEITGRQEYNYAMMMWD